MTRGIAASLLSASLTVAAPAQAPASPASKYVAVEIEHGRVPDDHLALVTNDVVVAADAAGAALEKALQARFASKPKLVLHWEAQSFRAAEKAESKRPFLVTEFCSADASAAHVLREPELGDAVGVLVGLPEPTRRAVMRCVIRLLAMQTCETAKADPWLAEIVAQGLTETLTNPSRAGGTDPWFDLQRFYHGRNAREGVTFPLRASLTSTDAPRDHDALVVETRGAALLAQFLGKESNGWVKKLLSKPAKPAGVAPNRLRVFESIAGKDLDKAQARWNALLTGFDVVWLPEGHVAPVKGGFVIAGSKAHRGSLISNAPMPKDGFVLRCRATIASVGTKELRIGFDAGDPNFLAIVFLPGSCSVREWIDKAGWQKPRVAADSSHGLDQAFDVEVQSGATLRVLVDGVELLTMPGEARTLQTGVVHFSVNDTVVTLENVRIDPMTPAGKK